jgi:hypothetical protein
MSRRACAGGLYARVAELVDALASGASVRKDVEVQVLSRAPHEISPEKKKALEKELFLS